MNGIDVSEWSPFLDKHLDVKYDVNTLEEGKGVAKETLQAELGFEVSCLHTRLCKSISIPAFLQLHVLLSQSESILVSVC